MVLKLNVLPLQNSQVCIRSRYCIWSLSSWRPDEAYRKRVGLPPWDLRCLFRPKKTSALGVNVTPGPNANQPVKRRYQTECWGRVNIVMRTMGTSNSLRLCLAWLTQCVFRQAPRRCRNCDNKTIMHSDETEEKYVPFHHNGSGHLQVGQVPSCTTKSGATPRLISGITVGIMVDRQGKALIHHFLIPDRHCSMSND